MMDQDRKRTAKRRKTTEESQLEPTPRYVHNPVTVGTRRKHAKTGLAGYGPYRHPSERRVGRISQLISLASQCVSRSHRPFRPTAESASRGRWHIVARCG